MEGALLSFLSIETIVFVIIINIAVTLFRKVIEWCARKIAPVFPDKYEPWWIEAWREWMLPAIPSVIGALIAFLLPSYPFPPVFSESIPGKVFFGIVAGFLANPVYRFFMYYKKKIFPKSLEEKGKEIVPDIDQEE